VPDHQRPARELGRRLGQHLAQRADLADPLEVAAFDDGKRLVQPHGLAAAQQGRVDGGRHRDAHAPAGGEDVDRLVGEPREEDAIAARWLGQPVDFLAERDELAAGLLERLGELLVAGRELREAARGLRQPLLEHPSVAWRLGELAAKQGDLFFEEADLRGCVRRIEPACVTTATSAGTVVGVHGILPPCSVSIRYPPERAVTVRRTGDPPLSGVARSASVAHPDGTLTVQRSAVP
jgi:hypothetical protein